MKRVLYVFLGIVAVCGLVFGAECLDIVNFGFFAPKYENVHRKVFEQTQSYVEGKRQDLTKYYDEWRRSDKEGKEALRSIVIEDFANFDTTLLTPQELDWYNKIIE
jgi:hypothetical protein